MIHVPVSQPRPDRDRRRWPSALTLGLVVLLAGWALSCGDSASNPKAADSPAAVERSGDGDYQNLVVLVIDTLRSDHLPGYGYERDTAPFLTRLGREGLQLDGYAASSWTRASVASLLTGLHPQSHQTIERSDHLPPEVPYLPEILSRAGFRTGAYISNGNVSSKLGFGRGYEVLDEYGEVAKPRARLVTDAGLAVADQLEPPFFLYVHYLDPHDPYVPSAPWGVDERPAEPYIQPQQLISGEVEKTAATLARLRDNYDGEIRDMDPQLERFLEGLDDRGLLDGTLVAVTSDHGEAFNEHGDLAHGHTLHIEEVGVPFILWSQDGEFAEPIVTQPFHHVDFVATMLAALGLEAPTFGDGTDRWDELRGAAEPSDALREMFFHLDLDDRAALAVETDGYKLIHESRQPRNRLYEVAVDREERSMLLGDGEAHEQRRSLLRSLVMHHNRLGDAAAERQARELDDSLRQKLAALGYLAVDTPLAELKARILPPKLAIFDDRPYGLFGNEDPDRMASRLTVVEAANRGQWLAGWSRIDGDGAVAETSASVVLRYPLGRRSLVLRGQADTATRVALAINGASAGERSIPAGPFEERFDLSERTNRRFPLAYVDLRSTVPQTLRIQEISLR